MILYPALDAAIDDLVRLQSDPSARQAQTTRVLRSLRMIVRERQRQEEIGLRKRAEGVPWRSCADPDIAGGELARYAVLGEEVGEVANAMLEAGYASEGAAWTMEGILHLRSELVQVAAVSLAWLEAIEARLGGG